MASGGWIRWDTKRTAESQHRIDIRWLRKHGHLGAGNMGSLSWSMNGRQTGQIGYIMHTDWMTLKYTYRPHGGEWESVEQTIRFDFTPCHFGGVRYWFLCRCGLRVAVIYGAGKYFLCRSCYGLTYASRQESPPFRLMSKAQKIRKRLEGSENLQDPFPPKPKHMHWRTYWKLYQQAERADRQSLFAIGKRFGILADV